MARWAAIIGARGTGKSSQALAVAGMLRERSIEVGGFLQIGVMDDLGRKSYDLRRLSTGETIPLARPASGTEADGNTSFCSFAFVDASFAAARAWLEEEIPRCGALIVDEVSKLEVGGQGHHEAIRRALSAVEDVVVVLCVRADQLFYVVESFGLDDDAVAVIEVPATEEDLKEFVSMVVASPTD